MNDNTNTKDVNQVGFVCTTKEDWDMLIVIFNTNTVSLMKYPNIMKKAFDANRLYMNVYK